MKRHFIKILKKVVAVALIIIVFAVTMNNALFIHSHVLPDGEVIQHAHPYNTSENPGTPYKTHHHSGFEFLLLNNLFSFLWVIIAAVFIVFNSNVQVIFISKFLFKKSFTYLYLLSRGPPVIS